MNDAPPFRVDLVAFDATRDALHAIRDEVFVREQHVPAELERDALDATCTHALARLLDGTPVGTARLTPDGHIGRMAVLADWRGRGVGDALLAALLQEARKRGRTEVALHAQAGAIEFYQRHGFQPLGERFQEAGIEHQRMRLAIDTPERVDSREGGVAATAAVIDGARRGLAIYTRDLDPGLLDQAAVVDAIRRLATRKGEIRVLLQDPAAAQRALAPLIALGQRLSSAIQFRAVEEMVDRSYPSAFIVNDRGGHYFRPLGHRWEGEARQDSPGRARHLRGIFDPFWERGRPCSEFRALGI